MQFWFGHGHGHEPPMFLYMTSSSWWRWHASQQFNAWTEAEFILEVTSTSVSLMKRHHDNDGLFNWAKYHLAKIEGTGLTPKIRYYRLNDMELAMKTRNGETFMTEDLESEQWPRYLNEKDMKRYWFASSSLMDLQNTIAHNSHENVCWRISILYEIPADTLCPILTIKRVGEALFFRDVRTSE